MSIPDSELDYHYSPSKWSHRYSPSEVIEKHVSVVTQATTEAHWVMDCENVTYGTGRRQQMDIYNAKNAKTSGLPVFVFIHGGYWQDMELSQSGFMAVPICNAGATVISVGYDLAPEVSMDKIVSEIKQGMRYILRYSKERQSRGVYLCGHSAGAQLVALMLSCEFAEDDAFDSDIIKGAFLVSGVYDLRPLVKTYVNDPLKLTEDDAWRYSPANFLSEIAGMSRHRDILFAVGEYDPPEFRRQSAEMEKELCKLKIKTRYLDIGDTDHFSVMEKLQNPGYKLTQEFLRLMNLT